MNILITGHDSFENKGCEALVVTTINILKDAFPSATFRCFSWNPDYDGSRYDEYVSGSKCRFIRHGFRTGDFSIRNRLWLFARNSLKIKTNCILWVPGYFWDCLAWADLVVVSGGDILADYGSDAVKYYFFPIAVAQAIGKGVYVFAQSISRYNDSNLLKMCLKYLNRATLITVREMRSYEYMRELGVKAPVYLTADPAFTLKPVGRQRTNDILKQERIELKGEQTIGFSVSRTVTQWGGGDYIRLLQDVAGAIDLLAERFPDTDFLFVPHVTYGSDPKNDDRIVGREVRQLVQNGSRVHLIEGDYSAQEIKGIIGYCDVFVGARTHATIASSSQCIPTLALAYSVKAYGIMEGLLDPTESVLDIKDVSKDSLFRKIVHIVEGKEGLSRHMKTKIEQIQQRSYENGMLAKEMFCKHSAL